LLIGIFDKKGGTMQPLNLCSLLTILILLNGCGTSLTGLGNQTKKFTPPSQMSPTDWDDPIEKERVWQASLVRIPMPDGSILKSTIASLNSDSFPGSFKLPTVIYLHGCTGLGNWSVLRLDFLAENGFIAIAPASFARKKYPKSCDPASHKGGLYRPTIIMRRIDAANAIREAKELPWVDENNLFLMGLSQGGITTATLDTSEGNTQVNARIVEGWGCHAGWYEYKGLNAPETEPVLSLLGELDPWFQNPWTKGHCGKFMSKTNDSKSIVFKEGSLRYKHQLLESSKVQKIAIDFLRNHIKNN